MHLLNRKGSAYAFTGGLHVKIQMGMLVHFFEFEIWADPVFSGGVKNWRYFSRLQATATGALQFTSNSNVIFRNYCVAMAKTICNPATPVHGVRAKFADR